MKVDLPTDVYSLGAMAYEMLTGVVPFKADSAVEIMAMHISRPAMPLRQIAPWMPLELEQLVLGMLGKDPARRPTIAQVHQALSLIRAKASNIQGTPTAFNENVWRYGASSVQFRDGRVADWSTAPGAPLKATSHPQPPERAWFTIGATQDEVLRVQGEPKETQELRWRYGKSWVFFSGGRVTGWDVARKSPLRVRLVAENPALKADDFTVGSTHDEVLAAQGTPDAFTDLSWRYGASMVYFVDGRVTRWDVRPESPLRIRRPTGP
jgi:hypothetical protein